MTRTRTRNCASCATRLERSPCVSSDAYKREFAATLLQLESGEQRRVAAAAAVDQRSQFSEPRHIAANFEAARRSPARAAGAPTASLRSPNDADDEKEASLFGEQDYEHQAEVSFFGPPHQPAGISSPPLSPPHVHGVSLRRAECERRESERPQPNRLRLQTIDESRQTRLQHSRRCRRRCHRRRRRHRRFSLSAFDRKFGQFQLLQPDTTRRRA